MIRETESRGWDALQEEKERISSAGKTRIEKWDLLRALLIFLVVLGHLVDYYTGDSARMRGCFCSFTAFICPASCLWTACSASTT